MKGVFGGFTDGTLLCQDGKMETGGATQHSTDMEW
jgi:hypothetical protein